MLRRASPAASVTSKRPSRAARRSRWSWSSWRISARPSVSTSRAGGSRPAASPAQRRAQARIAAALAEIGFALPGSVAVRSYRCGKDNCACHAEPPSLHGPYIQWSHLVDGRTVHTNLSADQLADYQPYFDNARRLRALAAELETLTIAAIEHDPRSNRASKTGDRPLATSRKRPLRPR